MQVSCIQAARRMRHEGHEGMVAKDSSRKFPIEPGRVFIQHYNQSLWNQTRPTAGYVLVSWAINQCRMKHLQVLIAPSRGESKPYSKFQSEAEDAAEAVHLIGTERCILWVFVS